MTAEPASEECDSITVILIPKAAGQLRQLRQRMNLSTTDLANRAISLYEFFDAQQRDGNDVITRDKETGMTKLVQLSDIPPEHIVHAAKAILRQPLAVSGGKRGRHRRPVLSRLST